MHCLKGGKSIGWKAKRSFDSFFFSSYDLHHHRHLLCHHRSYHLHHEHSHNIREKREWDEKRRGVLFAYERDSYFSSSSALALYELAWRISRDTNDLLWWGRIRLKQISHIEINQVPSSKNSLFRWAIIGHANLFLLKKIEDDRWKITRWSFKKLVVLFWIIGCLNAPSQVSDGHG